MRGPTECRRLRAGIRAKRLDAEQARVTYENARGYAEKVPDEVLLLREPPVRDLQLAQVLVQEVRIEEQPQAASCQEERRWHAPQFRRELPYVEDVEYHTVSGEEAHVHSQGEYQSARRHSSRDGVSIAAARDSVVKEGSVP